MVRVAKRKSSSRGRYMSAPDKAMWVDRCILISGLHIAMCVTEKQFRKELKRLGITQEPAWPEIGVAVTYTCKSTAGKSCCFVCMNKEEQDRNWVVSGLVHESVHVFQRAMETLEESDPGEEIEAYAIQNIFINLSDAYNKLCAVNAKPGGE